MKITWYKWRENLYYAIMFAFAVLFFIALSSCSNTNILPKPKTTMQRIAYANGALTAINKTTTALLANKKISVKTAVYVYQSTTGLAKQLDLLQKEIENHQSIKNVNAILTHVETAIQTLQADLQHDTGGK